MTTKIASIAPNKRWRLQQGCAIAAMSGAMVTFDAPIYNHETEQIALGEPYVRVVAKQSRPDFLTAGEADDSVNESLRPQVITGDAADIIASILRAPVSQSALDAQTLPTRQ